MDKSLYIAMTGASATLQAQAGVAHNLANLDTVGFKAELAATEAFQIPGAGLPTRFDAMPKPGAFDASAGPLIATGGDLDIALHENRWLAVQDAAGGEAYTRAGDLRLTPNGVLTTASGHPLLSESGPIAIPPHAKLTIGGDGTVSIVPQGQGPETVAIVARLKVVDAADAALTRGEDGLMRTSVSLPPAAGTILTSGAVEGSNAKAADLLVQMIQLSRQFEMQVKAIGSADENARAANSLLKLG